MQLKNTCEGIHLVKKLPAISLQAFKFTIKMNFTHIFKDFGWILSYYLLWFHGRLFHALMGESFVFQMGGFIFKWERGCGAPWGTLVLVGGAKGGGGSKKIIRWGGHSPPPLWETLELWIFFYLGWWFLSKKCHFQLKQLCKYGQRYWTLKIADQKPFSPNMTVRNILSDTRLRISSEDS